MKPPFRIEFDETGGYDCMSSAYVIYDLRNKTVCKIDVTDYTESNDWDTLHSECPEAAEIAERLLKGLNQ